MARQPVTSGSLHIPKDLGVSESQAASIERTWNTIEGVDARLRTRGIHENKVPDIECPEVTTAVLVTVDIREYTTVFSAQLRWCNYAVRLLADARALLLQVENEMDDIASAKRTEWRKLYTGKDKMSVQEMADAIAQDPRYRELKLQKQELDQEELKLRTWYESLERNLKTVSRQIENRRTESAAGNREANMPGSASGRWEGRRA